VGNEGGIGRKGNLEVKSGKELSKELLKGKCGERQTLERKGNLEVKSGKEYQKNY